MTHTASCSFSAASGSSRKFTGKERDGESGLDDFGARYYSSQYGRFMTPDEFKGGIVDPFTGQDIETNTALPYADITDPQTLNKYGYVRNNPLRYVDPDGHDIEFKSDVLEEMFNNIGKESQTFRTETESAKADHNIEVTVQEVGAQPLADHAPGDATAYMGTDGKVHMTINVKSGDEKTAEHEVGHEKDARTNTKQFFKDARQDAKDKGGPNEKSHNDRPVEKRANEFKKTVENERKQYNKEQKLRKRHEES